MVVSGHGRCLKPALLGGVSLFGVSSITGKLSSPVPLCSPRSPSWLLHTFPWVPGMVHPTQRLSAGVLISLVNWNPSHMSCMWSKGNKLWECGLYSEQSLSLCLPEQQPSTATFCPDLHVSNIFRQSMQTLVCVRLKSHSCAMGLKESTPNLPWWGLRIK